MSRVPHGSLAGRVVVVAVERPAHARALAARGAAVVVAGGPGEAGAVGRLVAELAASGARAAAFVGSPQDAADGDALAELVAELFPPPAAGRPEPA